MAYEGPFSNRIKDNMVQIIEMGIHFSVSSNGGTTPANLQESEGPIILDATEEYGKSYSAQLSTHPVSDKTDRADHYQVDPVTIQFSGVISNDSIRIYEWAAGLGTGTSRCQAYIERLEKIFKEKILVEIRLPDAPSTQNCMITSLSITRDAQWSNGFKVSITAQQFILTSGSITTAPNPIKKDAVAKTPNTGSNTSRSTKVTKQAAKNVRGYEYKINQAELTPYSSAPNTQTSVPPLLQRR